MDDLQCAKAGDRGALGRVLKQLLPGIRRKIGRYVSDRADLDDLSQQVLLTIATQLGRYRAEGHLQGWANTIAARAAFAHLRGRKRNVIQFDPDWDRGDEGRGARTVQTRDQLRVLQDVLDTLSPERKMVYILQEVEGYTAPEVATMLQIPVGTVYGRLRDARLHVRAAFEAADGDVFRREGV